MFICDFFFISFYTSCIIYLHLFSFLKEPESVEQSTKFLCTPLSGEASMKESVMGTQRERERERERERGKERERDLCIFLHFKLNSDQNVSSSFQRVGFTCAFEELSSFFF